MHRVADIVSRGNDDGEQNEDDGRVLAVQSVDQVVVEVALEVAEIDGSFHDAVHLAAGDERSSFSGNYKQQHSILTSSPRSALLRTVANGNNRVIPLNSAIQADCFKFIAIFQSSEQL